VRCSVWEGVRVLSEQRDEMKTAASSTMQPRDLQVGKLIWTMSLLILTSWILDKIAFDLLLNVDRGRDITYWSSLIARWSPLYPRRIFPIQVTILSVQLVVVLYFYRPLKGLFTLPAEEECEQRTSRGLVIGVTGGAFAFLVSIPFLLFSKSVIHLIAHEFIPWPLSPALVREVGLLLVVTVLSELVFRGIVFRSLRDVSSFWPAAVGSALLSSYMWPIPDLYAAIILGVTSALLFQKTKMLVSSILANATLTILAETFLVLRDLHFF